MNTTDTLILARGRLLKQHGTLWKAAAAYRSGYSANWLGRRLKGQAPIDADLAAWIARETGLDPASIPITPPHEGDSIEIPRIEL
jgi:hypothetical protein